MAPNGTATRAPEPVAADRRAELVHHPVTAVRAALDPMAKLSNPRTEGGQSMVDVATAGGQQFTLAIDATTKLPSKVTTRAYNVNLGDVVIGTAFADYQAVGGLQLPAKLTTATDDFTTQDVTLSKQEVDAAAGDLAAPAAAAQAPTGPPPAQMVTVEPLAKGIWWLAGGSHHSVLVEFSDHLTLIEAPLNEARALAVIAKARELVPGKPLTQLVNSHHHFDHSGGVRAAISEGLTVITHQGNVAFFQEMAKRAHTIQPDALSKSGKAATVQGVDGQLSLSDPTMTVNLIGVSGPHSQTMLVAHFPKEKLLVEVDVYTPGGAVQMFAGQFLEELKKHNLAVDRVVPLHGTIAPYAQFLKEAVGAGAGVLGGSRLQAPGPRLQWSFKSHRVGCRSTPTRRSPRSRCPRAPWTRTVTSSAPARSSPTRPSASTRPATPARICCSRCATGWGSTRTSSSRPPATAPTTARCLTRCAPRTGAPAASPPSIAT